MSEALLSWVSLYGAPALGAHVARRFGLAHTFIEVPNPA